MTREYGQYCPVTIGTEVLADRWTPMILREMLLGSTRFNDIERGLPGISRSLLSQRLRHLERKGVVQRAPARAGRGSEYHLTPAGQDLEPIIMGIGEWASRWLLREPSEADVDPRTLTWWMHLRVDRDALPDERVVVEFRYQGNDPMTIWLVLDRGEPSVCNQHPGFDTDLLLTTEPVAFMRVFSGLESLDRARKAGRVSLEGPPRLVRGFSSWFLWSPFAPTVREVAAAR